jgi:molybdopterin-guanine dinucleotide biosynthesis protein A
MSEFSDPAPIFGLVLAGGRSRRMGRDKAALDYHGVPQARWAHRLLAASCERAYVSVRADQRAQPAFTGLPLISDDDRVAGPAAGLLAAWRHAPSAAWLILAADLPLVDSATLDALIEGRDTRAPATAFCHPDGTPEPLCTIWEPAARLLVERAAADGEVSLRRMLAGATILAPPDATRLASANSPIEEAAVRRRLAAPVP